MDFEDSTASEPPDRSPGVADVASPGSHRTTTDLHRDNNSGTISIDIIDESHRPGAEWTTFLHNKLTLVAQHLRLTGEVRVLIVDDDTMSREHLRHLGDAATTDVITFDLAEGASEQTRELDVDLLLCADEAIRQAVDRNIPVERELLLYAVHGLLHCLGYDDHDEQDAQAMHALEDQLLEAIGVGTTFAAPTTSHNKAATTTLRITPDPHGGNF